MDSENQCDFEIREKPTVAGKTQFVQEVMAVTTGVATLERAPNPAAGASC